jgi:hypothetical protein
MFCQELDFLREDASYLYLLADYVNDLAEGDCGLYAAVPILIDSSNMPLEFPGGPIVTLRANTHIPGYHALNAELRRIEHCILSGDYNADTIADLDELSELIIITVEKELEERVLAGAESSSEPPKTLLN